MDLQKEITPKEIVEAASALLPKTLGSLDIPLKHFETPVKGNKESFGFINSDKQLDEAEASAMGCIIAPLKCEEKIIQMNSSKTWLLSPNVDLAARQAKKTFVFPTPFKASFEGTHPTAVVHPTAEVSIGVVIGPHAVIGENVRIGEGSFIGANTVVEENVNIGSHVTIHPQVYVGHSCEIGHHCEIMPQVVLGSEGYGYAHDQNGNHYRVPHTGKVILEDDVHIGGACCIDRGTIEDTVIGKGTKLDNLIHLAHNTVIGKNGLLTAQFGCAGSSTIGDNFMCGGKTSLAGHIKVTDNVQVAGVSTITNNVTEPGAYGGYPLIPLKQHLKVKASSIHLPELRKQVNRMMKKLFPEDQGLLTIHLAPTDLCGRSQISSTERLLLEHK